MHSKDDWPQAKERLKAFWRNELLDRCCVGVTAPRKTSKYKSYRELTDGLNESITRIPESDTQVVYRWWVDPESNYQRMINWFENTYFGGEAVPCTYVNWGAMAMACFFGGQPRFTRETAWYYPAISDWNTREWKFNPQTNPYWKSTLDIVKCYLENAPAYSVSEGVVPEHACRF